jgi:hypothetical protein
MLYAVVDPEETAHVNTDSIISNDPTRPRKSSP